MNTKVKIQFSIAAGLAIISASITFFSLPKSVTACMMSSDGGSMYCSPADRVSQLYRDILGRNPDPSGLSLHVKLIEQNGYESVRAGIASGQESRSNINNLYKRYLCRNADPDGMDHHIKLLVSGQMNLAQIHRGIATSAEAKQHPFGCR